jgi:hypothetical protein
MFIDWQSQNLFLRYKGARQIMQLIRAIEGETKSIDISPLRGEGP